MTRKEILQQALSCVTGDREQDYGSPENNFRTIANLWTDYLLAGDRVVVNGELVTGKDIDIVIDPFDVAAMLALLKIARIGSGHSKQDNWVDLAGYAACGGEIQTEERST